MGDCIMGLKSIRHRERSAFTLVEMIVVIGILGILIAFILPQIALYQASSERIACGENLNTLWQAFSECANEPGGWPQLPPGVRPGSREEENFWLVFSSNNLNISSRQWHCPTIDRVMRQHPPQAGTAPLIHYLPTLFDARPGTPNRWPRMPWFSEIANVHGHGNLTVTTLGEIVPSSPQP
jgi:prepilin-type N-terminal cleavage/methylation domain-containing protein